MTAHQPDTRASLLELPLFTRAQARKAWLLAGVIALAAAYAAAVSPHWWIGPDSALYLSLARNLVADNGYTLAGQPHTHVPPGFPLVLAGLVRIGAGSFLALNLLMAAAGLVTLIVVYLLLRRMVHPDWAFALAAVAGLSNEMLQRSGEILSDVPFMLLATVAMLLYYRGLAGGKRLRLGWEIASLLLVASCWLRAAGVPLALGAAVGLVLAARGKARLRAAVNAAAICAALATCLVLAYLYLQAHPQPAAGSYAGTLNRTLGGRSAFQVLAQTLEHFKLASGQLSRLLIAQRPPLWLCMIVFVAPIALGMILRGRRGDLVGPVAVAVYVAGLSAVSPLPRTRYFLPISPLLILYLAEGWGWLVLRTARRDSAASGWVKVLLILLLGFNIPLVGRNIYEKHWADCFTNQQAGKWEDEVNVAGFLRGLDPFYRDESGATFRRMDDAALLCRRAPFDGYILAEQAVGFLAGSDCHPISSAFENDPPPNEELERLLHRWQIAYVVVDSGKPTPLDTALEKLLAPQGPPAFTHGGLRLYRFTPPKPGRPTTGETGAESGTPSSRYEPKEAATQGMGR